jgi:hypothetical protein
VSRSEVRGRVVSGNLDDPSAAGASGVPDEEESRQEEPRTEDPELGPQGSLVVRGRVPISGGSRPSNDIRGGPSDEKTSGVSSLPSCCFPVSAWEDQPMLAGRPYLDQIYHGVPAARADSLGRQLVPKRAIAFWSHPMVPLHRARAGRTPRVAVGFPKREASGFTSLSADLTGAKPTGREENQRTGVAGHRNFRRHAYLIGRGRPMDGGVLVLARQECCPLTEPVSLAHPAPKGPSNQEVSCACSSRATRVISGA